MIVDSLSLTNNIMINLENSNSGLILRPRNNWWCGWNLHVSPSYIHPAEWHYLLVDELFKFFVAFNSFWNIIIENEKLLSQQECVAFIHTIAIQRAVIVQPLHCIIQNIKSVPVVMSRSQKHPSKYMYTLEGIALMHVTWVINYNPHAVSTSEQISQDGVCSTIKAHSRASACVTHALTFHTSDVYSTSHRVLVLFYLTHNMIQSNWGM